jgi:hypothetical protein
MALEERIGVVTDYLSRIGVAVIHSTDGDLDVGDQAASLAARPSFGNRSHHCRSSIRR